MRGMRVARVKRVGLGRHGHHKHVTAEKLSKQEAAERGLSMWVAVAVTLMFYFAVGAADALWWGLGAYVVTRLVIRGRIRL